MRQSHCNFGIAVVLGLMLLAVLRISPAAASCGSTSCFLVIGSQAGVPQEGMLTMNLTYNYVNQGDLLDGTTGIIPEVDTQGRRDGRAIQFHAHDRMGDAVLESWANF